MAKALPQFLNLNTLRDLKLQGELAAAAYEDGRRPDGFRDVNLAAIGVDEGNIAGPFFDNGGASARLMARDGDWYLAFRGTDSNDDLLDFLSEEDEYIERFDDLLNAISRADNFDGKLFVTGHSLGGAVSHLLNEDRGDYGAAIRSADYFSFASPIFDNPGKVASYGHANDGIYGLDEDVDPPFVERVFYYTDEDGTDQPDPQDEDNEPIHAIESHVEGLARIIASDAFDPQYGLTERRGLSLDQTVVLSGTHDKVVLSDALEGDVVLLGVDGRLGGEAKANVDLSDILYGRDVGSVSDWIDGMRGSDLLIGLAGADRLIGGAGADTLKGGSGADDLFGGAGRDVLIGGRGRDEFVFDKARGEADVVRDFHAASDGRDGQRDLLVIEARGFEARRGDEFDVFNSRSDWSDRGDEVGVFYQRRSGDVFFDADGKGGDGALLVATLRDGPDSLRASDIDLI
jgi:Ca2+-binding RTX toxin-like protein